MLFQRLLPFATAGLVVVSPLHRPDSVEFRAEEGRSLRRSFEERATLELVSARMTMGGEEEEMEELEVEAVLVRELGVTDEYLGVSDGAVRRLRRSFDDVTGRTEVESVEPSGAEEFDEAELGSELEGLGVVFAWDEEDERFEASWDEDSEGDDALLAGLVEDLDLRALLPDGDVDENDSWEIDAEVFAGVLAFGGDLAERPDIDDDTQAEPILICGFLALSEIGGDIDGDVTATYEGSRDGEAVISFRVELSYTRDLTDALRKVSEGYDTEGIGNAESMELEGTFDGEGTLTWSVANGHALRFELEGELESSIDLTPSQDFGMDVLMELEFVGETELELELE